MKLEYFKKSGVGRSTELVCSPGVPALESGSIVEVVIARGWNVTTRCNTSTIHSPALF